MIPAAIIPPAGNPFVNNTAIKVPIKIPNNIVEYIVSTHTPFPPINDTITPAKIDPHPIGEVINFIMLSLEIFLEVMGIKRNNMRKKNTNWKSILLNSVQYSFLSNRK